MKSIKLYVWGSFFCLASLSTIFAADTCQISTVHDVDALHNKVHGIANRIAGFMDPLAFFPEAEKGQLKNDFEKIKNEVDDSELLEESEKELLQKILEEAGRKIDPLPEDKKREPQMVSDLYFYSGKL